MRFYQGRLAWSNWRGNVSKIPPPCHGFPSSSSRASGHNYVALPAEKTSLQARMSSISCTSYPCFKSRSTRGAALMLLPPARNIPQDLQACSKTLCR